MDGFIWSYSRVGCFSDCPYKFFLKYLYGLKEEPMFYASYGSFIHKILEEYYKGIISKEEMKSRFLSGFSKEVRGERPSADVVSKYIEDGYKYFSNFEPFRFETVGVEERLEFNICGIPFVGIVDFIGRDDDGSLVVVDNKSRALKPRSSRKTPTKNDIEIDSMLKQLYIYSYAIKEKYGEFPKLLCFNCFRNGVFIEEPFDETKYNETIKWVVSEIDRIKKADEWYPIIDFFQCKYLCGVHDQCEFYEKGMT